MYAHVVARGAIDTRIRSRKKLYIRRLTHALLCKTLQIHLIHRNLQSLTRKSKNSDMKIKKPKKPKNLTFQVFLGFLKNLKNLGFLKWVSTALYRIDDSVVLSSQTLALNRQFTISFCAEMYCSSLDCHSRLCWRKAHLARLNPYHGGVQSPLPTD